MGFTALYRSIFDVVRDFLHDEAFGEQEKVLAKYLKPDLLIIDDMGMKQLPKRSGEYLFELIMRRYETRSTMMTSNRPLEDWGKLIGDVPAATAILDRFLHHAEVVTLTGRSYRLRHQARQAPEGAGAKQNRPKRPSALTRMASSQNRPKRPSAPTRVQVHPKHTKAAVEKTAIARKSKGSHCHWTKYLRTDQHGTESKDNGVLDNSLPWPVLKRPSVAGFEAPDDISVPCSFLQRMRSFQI
jgi:hypothetical protein